MFTIVFCWTIVFSVIGIFLWRKGLRDAKGELQPLEFGRHTKGEITGIKTDYSKRINDKNPKTLEFIFTANGHKWAGTVPNIMDPIEHWKRPGDQIWVVYMPEDPNISSVWPPMK